MEQLTGWWFTFDTNTNKSLGDIIQKLATEFSDGKVFVPHLSFYSYVIVPPDDLEVIANELSALIRPFSISTKGITFAKPIHKTLFIETDIAEPMKRAVSYMEKKFQQNYVLNPHISLSYNDNLPEDVRQRLCSEIEIPEKISIDSISYYIPPVGKESAEYFYNWPAPTKIELK